MKKILKITTSIVGIITLLIALIAIIVLLHFKYIEKTTKKVTLKNYGTFRIPKDWIVTSKDKEYYISDKKLNEDDVEIYFIQAKYKNSESNEDYLYNSKYKEFKELESLDGEMFSNSAIYGKMLYEINNKQQSKYYLSFHPAANEETKYLTFVSISKKIKIKDVQKIAKSYVLE